MLAISHAELSRKPNAGKTTICPSCGKEHKITYGRETSAEADEKPSRMIGTVRCGMKSFLVAINGKLITEE